MNIRTLLLLLSVIVLGWGQPCLAAETPDPGVELKTLIVKVQEKLKADHGSKEDLAAELKEFDALLKRHAGHKTEAVAEILVMKAMLYLEVFKDVDTTLVLMAQLQKEFPDTSHAKRSHEMIETIKRQKESLDIQKKLAIGNKFPDFDEKDREGKPLSIARFKGQVVLLDFWATWCGPCVRELPNVIETYSKFHGKGFEVIGISLDEREQALTDFVEKREMKWPQYFDGAGWGNKLAVRYGVQSIPATYLLDQEGKILAKDLRGAALGEAVAKALAATK